MGSVVPGVLEAYDLPDLAARLAPLPLTIQAPVDAMGEPVSRTTRQVSGMVYTYSAHRGAGLRQAMNGGPEPPPRWTSCDCSRW